MDPPRPECRLSGKGKRPNGVEGTHRPLGRGRACPRRGPWAVSFCLAIL